MSLDENAFDGIKLNDRKYNDKFKPPKQSENNVC